MEATLFPITHIEAGVFFKVPMFDVFSGKCASCAARSRVFLAIWGLLQSG